VCAAALATTACASRDYGFEKGSNPTERDAAARPRSATETAAIEARFRAAWARRDEPAALGEAIAALRALLAARGGADYGTLVLLARAHYLLGEEAEEKDRKIAAYEAGMQFGDLALDALPEFHAAFARTQSIDESVESVPKAGIDAIYWDAVNTGKWAHEKGVSKVFFMKDKVKRMVDRVLALDETWWWGAAHRYLGAYYAALPGFAGRDLDASKAHFDRAIAIAPDMLSTRVLMADYWARQNNDRRAFKALLDGVLATRPETIPALVPEQRLERAKAKRLLDHIDDDFDPDDAPAPAAPTATAVPGGAQ
jgi:hypothetical protein